MWFGFLLSEFWPIFTGNINFGICDINSEIVCKYNTTMNDLRANTDEFITMHSLSRSRNIELLRLLIFAWHIHLPQFDSAVCARERDFSKQRVLYCMYISPQGWKLLRNRTILIVLLLRLFFYLKGIEASVLEKYFVSNLINNCSLIWMFNLCYTSVYVSRIPNKLLTINTVRAWMRFSCTDEQWVVSEWHAGVMSRRMQKKPDWRMEEDTEERQRDL